MHDPTTTNPAPARMKPWKIAVQLIGFGVGIALLVWCVRVAMRPANREPL